MYVLAVDTATPTVSVAIGKDGMVLGHVLLGTGQHHAEQLAPAIEYLARECEVSLDRLGGIGVGIGPGLFTGLRVGVTTAKVLAQVLRVPVVGLPSLDLLAYPLRHAHGRLIAAVIDARRQEVFTARYRPVPGGVQRVSEYEVGSPARLAADLAAIGEDTLLAGDGAVLYREHFDDLEHVELAGPGFSVPSAAALIALTTVRMQQEEFQQPADLVPMYLRESDAELSWGPQRNDPGAGGA
jgi:tRNA threonylcarbamoyladenosine biosynthesis protein TsaB